MGQTTEISWTDHTWNPWWGCIKVSPGCTNCYADAFDRRTGGNHWGPNSERRFFGDKHWQEPLKWNAEAEKAGERRRVFCASMADVFELRDDLIEPRAGLFGLIDRTPWLDWQLLTKRPENITQCIQQIVNSDIPGYHPGVVMAYGWEMGIAPINVWLGTTVENQEYADKRIPHLLQVPAAVRFLSVEPMLGKIDLFDFLYEDNDRLRMWIDVALTGDIHWVICGGESGPKRRPFEIEWAQSLHDQCKAVGVAYFFKQDSAFKPGQQGRAPDHLWNCREFPKVEAAL